VDETPQARVVRRVEVEHVAFDGLKEPEHRGEPADGRLPSAFLWSFAKRVSFSSGATSSAGMTRAIWKLERNADLGRDDPPPYCPPALTTT
jgi:hypothetical protein